MGPHHGHCETLPGWSVPEDSTRFQSVFITSCQPAVAILHSDYCVQVNLLFAVPPMLVMMAKHPQLDDFDLSHLRRVCVGAAPIPGEITTALEKKLPNCNVGQGLFLDHWSTIIKSRKLKAIILQSVHAFRDLLDLVHTFASTVLWKYQSGLLHCFSVAPLLPSKRYLKLSLAVYGMSETSIILTASPLKDLSPGSVGVLVPSTEVKVGPSILPTSSPPWSHFPICYSLLWTAEFVPLKKRVNSGPEDLKSCWDISIILRQIRSVWWGTDGWEQVWPPQCSS